MRSILRRPRAAWLLLLLLLLHFGAPARLERLRLQALARVSTPLERTAAATEGIQPPSEWLSAGETARRSSAQAAAAAHPGGAVAEVLDLDRRRHRLLLARGRRDGLRLGARVLQDGRCVGRVDRVEEGLARASLLSRPGTRVAVQIAPERALPGGLERLLGTMAVEGGEGLVTEAFLPRAWRRGDRVQLVAEPGSPGPVVGQVTEEGVEPKVEILALDQGSGVLSVDLVRAASASPPDDDALFERVPLRVRLHRRRAGAESLLVAPTGVELPAGSALTGAGWLLGIVHGQSGRFVVASGVESPGRRLSVHLVRAGEATGAEITCREPGHWEVRAGPGAALPPGPVLVFTAGGDALVPSWMLLGRGELQARGADRALRVERPRDWPGAITGRRFRHAEQRRALLGARR